MIDVTFEKFILILHQKMHFFLLFFFYNRCLMPHLSNFTDKDPGSNYTKKKLLFLSFLSPLESLTTTPFSVTFSIVMLLTPHQSRNGK